MALNLDKSMFNFGEETANTRYAITALTGASGSGKTYNALKLAGMLTSRVDGVAAIDTEHGRMSHYRGAPGLPDFKPINIGARASNPALKSFHPDVFSAAIDYAYQDGYEVLVIDSLTHAWAGKPNGVLDIVEQRTQGNPKANQRAWGFATPLWDSLIEKITGTPMHIIICLRAKTESFADENTKRRTSIGIAPIVRVGTEYEMTFFASLNADHTIYVEKGYSLTGNIYRANQAQNFYGDIKNWIDAGGEALKYGDGTNVSDNPRERKSYAEYQAAHSGNAPQNVGALREWATNVNTDARRAAVSESTGDKAGNVGE